MRINEWVSSIADAGRELWQRSGPGGRGGKRAIDDLCQELCSSKGEAMGTAIAQEVVTAYRTLNESERLEFLQMLLNDYGPDRDTVIARFERYQAEESPDHLKSLGDAIEGGRRSLFRLINMAPGGTGTIVGMRADLLDLLRDHTDLKSVDDDLLYVLRSWFNRGFLTLATISWESPAHILEKLIAYEAVHEMQGWHDLRRRLAEDRRCFAFFHPALPDEPLIFVQVALVEGLSGNIQDLLAEADGQASQKFDTAIFYSISNCQKGLKGISFGNFLIKQVVLELRREFDSLKHFATLSPVPGFRRWLGKELEQPDLVQLSDVQRTLVASMESPDWHENPDKLAALRPLLMQLCTLYLAHARRGDEPLDPVERFHLGNGAQIARLNWLGDISSGGLTQSAGMLVNYGYELRKVEANHEAFVNEHRIVMASEFRKLSNDSEDLLRSDPH